MNRTVVRIAGALATLVAAYAAASMGHMARVIVGAGVGLPSFILMVISRRQLGASFAIMPEAKSLVTTGLYSHIQHPMYLFLDLLLVLIERAWTSLRDILSSGGRTPAVCLCLMAMRAGSIAPTIVL